MWKSAIDNIRAVIYNRYSFEQNHCEVAQNTPIVAKYCQNAPISACFFGKTPLPSSPIFPSKALFRPYKTPLDQKTYPNAFYYENQP